MGLKLAKERIDLRVSFGAHGTKKNAEPLQVDYRRFGPHVFAFEDAFSLEDKRQPGCVNLNTQLKDLQKHLTRGGGLEIKPDTGHPDSEFDLESKEMLIYGPKVILYNSEGYTQDTLNFFSRVFREYEEQRANVLRLFISGDVSGAIDLYVSSLKAFVHGYLVMRNARIVEGFEKMLEEVPAQYPRTLDAIPLRVMGRFGTLHEGIVDGLRNAGFSVRVLKDFEVESLENALVIALSRDPSLEPTDEQKMRAFFGFVYMNVFCQAAFKISEEEFNRRMLEMFLRIGGLAGFIDMMQVALATSDRDAFMRAMHERFSA